MDVLLQFETQNTTLSTWSFVKIYLFLASLLSNICVRSVLPNLFIFEIFIRASQSCFQKLVS